MLPDRKQVKLVHAHEAFSVTETLVLVECNRQESQEPQLTLYRIPTMQRTGGSRAKLRLPKLTDCVFLLCTLSFTRLFLRSMAVEIFWMMWHQHDVPNKEFKLLKASDI